MFIRFPFHKILALLILGALLATPGSAAWTAHGEQVLPQNPQPSPLGSTIFPEYQVSSPLSPEEPKRYLPQSAYDSRHGRFLVVWHQTFDSGSPRQVYGQMVNLDGTRYGSQFKISSQPNSAFQPAVAYNYTNNEYMVLFVYDPGGFGYKYDINARRVNADTGALLGTELIIEAVDSTAHWSPSIAYNTLFNEYMAVWQNSTATVPPVSTGIGMRMLDNLGGTIYGTILTSDGAPSDPDVTYTPVNDRYMVVWDYINIWGKNAIVGDLRDSLGNRIKLVSVISNDTNNALSPRVTTTFGLTGPGWFYVTFDYENEATNHDIGVAFTDNLATIFDPMFHSEHYISGTTNDTHPDVAGTSDSSRLVLVFQRADAMGAKVMMVPGSTSWPAEPTEVCFYFGGNCETPSVFYGGGSFLITYAEEYLSSSSPGEKPATPVLLRHIFNRVFNTEALFVPVILRQ